MKNKAYKITNGYITRVNNHINECKFLNKKKVNWNCLYYFEIGKILSLPGSIMDPQNLGFTLEPQYMVPFVLSIGRNDVKE